MLTGITSPNAFFTSYKEAAWEKDVGSMIGLYYNDVLIYDMWDANGFTSGLKEWSAIITEWLTSLNDERVRVSFDMINVQKSELMGFASALIQYQALAPDDTVLRGMRNRITLCFLKTGEFWKVKHQHTSAPIDANLQANLAI